MHFSQVWVTEEQKTAEKRLASLPFFRLVADQSIRAGDGVKVEAMTADGRKSMPNGLALAAKDTPCSECETCDGVVDNAVSLAVYRERIGQAKRFAWEECSIPKDPLLASFQFTSRSG